jgi:hypothetical protein
MGDRAVTIEGALDAARQAAGEVVAEAGRLAAAGKKAARAADVGDLKGLRQALANLVDIADRTGQAAVRAAGGWAFADEEEEESFLGDGRYQRELLEAARRDRLGLQPLDGVLACFPSLVRIKAKERAVEIDRKPYRFIRPSHLVAHLKAVQARPARNNPKPFLEALHDAYQHTLATKRGKSRVAKLTDVYKVLTLLPTVRRDYSIQELARDLYLLEEGGVTETAKGARLRFHAATGTKAGNPLRVVARNGEEKVYYSIEFLERR